MDKEKSMAKLLIIRAIIIQLIFGAAFLAMLIMAVIGSYNNCCS